MPWRFPYLACCAVLVLIGEGYAGLRPGWILQLVHRPCCADRTCDESLQWLHSLALYCSIVSAHGCATGCSVHTGKVGAVSVTLQSASRSTSNCHSAGQSVYIQLSFSRPVGLHPTVIQQASRQEGKVTNITILSDAHWSCWGTGKLPNAFRGYKHVMYELRSERVELSSQRKWFCRLLSKALIR